jgi:hypothetical protein
VISSSQVPRVAWPVNPISLAKQEPLRQGNVMPDQTIVEPLDNLAAMDISNVR